MSFIELCDGLMRRMQDAKSKHMEKKRRQIEERNKNKNYNKLNTAMARTKGRRSTMQ